MKATLLSLALAFTLCAHAQTENIPEPEFIGECVIIKADNSVTKLEKQLATNRSVASTGLILTGIGKARKQIQIDGCCANVNFSKNDDVKFIVRNVDNLSDPLAVIQVFKFEKKKKYRRAELASQHSFGTQKTNNLDYVSFSGKKHGESSYLIKLDRIEPGEYAIVVTNPNALDEKQTVVSTFAVTD